MTNTNYPLHGVRILDMATVVAAPFAATLCGDMGAEVVKLELPQGTDPLRNLTPVHEGHSLFFKTANRGKKGISLDVRKPQGRELFLRLIEDFDVLVENFRTGTMDQWGLDIKTLHAHNPRLIVLRLTGFGQTGPYARRPGFARIFEAMSGFAHLTGEQDGPPQHMNYPLGDAIAGLYGAFSICAALTERNAQAKSEQRGVEIDLAATEALIRLLDPLAAEYKVGGIVRNRSGSKASYTAPSNVYKSNDGFWITLVGTSDPIYARICRAMERPDLITDKRFSTSAARLENLDELDEMIAVWCKSLNLSDLQTRLNREDVPNSKVYAIDDAFEDPHFQARGVFMDMTDPVLGKIPAPSPVPKFVGRTYQTPCVGPDTGADNAAVYGQIGVSEDNLRTLREGHII